jgi:hypothetical protein
MSLRLILSGLISVSALGMAAAPGAAAAPAVGGPEIEKAVASLGDGTVRMTYAARIGVCGDGSSSISFDGGNSWHVSRGRHDGWERECDEGPVRVSMRVRDGEVVRIKTRVGGHWRPAGEGVVDLGEISPKEAADFLLDIAWHSRRPVAEDAILPAILARDVEVWPRVLEIARDEVAPADVREVAVFWLGQLAGDKATEGLVSIVGDDDEDLEVRQAAVFALSQGHGRSHAEYLMKIARTNPHPEIRKSAMFWLAQRDDPEVLDFFEEILLGN